MQYCPSNSNPYDDDVDIIAEAEKFNKEFKAGMPVNPRNMVWAATIIEYLLDELYEEGR